MKQLWTSARISLLALGVSVALGSTAIAQRDGQPRTQNESQQTSQGQPRAQQGQQGDQSGSQQPGQNQQRAQSNAQQQGSRAAQAGSLSQLTEDHENLSTFVRALEETGLADSLTGDTQYTVFAPTDEAFEDMGRSVDQLLSADNRQQLISLLRAHIVADDVSPEMARQLSEAKTLDGDTITLEQQDGKLMVGDASVVDSNIQHGSLRIYTIDEVLDRGESQVATSQPGENRRN
jgi:uncharacterized surface protein with fasciclin (FAS1) repeats